MDITAEQIKNLRKLSGAGVMDCRGVLIKTEGDIDKALQLLKEQNLLKVEKKAARTTAQGVVESYVHAGGRIGVIVEVNCETDFVARTEDFKELAHNLAMQIAAMAPVCINKEDVPDSIDVDPQTASLLTQPFIRDTTITVQDIINNTIAKTGENIKVRRFARFELGEETK
ncbi:MAG: elongation factor Ts [Dehalococcoidales bacterium]|nr:elongation factor Ts [Dehalococcoidales bacterium]